MSGKKTSRKRELSLLGDALWELMNACDKVRLRVGECRNAGVALSALRASLIEDLARQTRMTAAAHANAVKAS